MDASTRRIRRAAAASALVGVLLMLAFLAIGKGSPEPGDYPRWLYWLEARFPRLVELAYQSICYSCMTAVWLADFIVLSMSPRRSTPNWLFDILFWPLAFLIQGAIYFLPIFGIGNVIHWVRGKRSGNR